MIQTNRTFRVFVSSTFSDLKDERNVLQKYVFPRLSELAKVHGCRFQAIDLRWGISEEAGLDQRTMQICLNELARCQKTTPRPNFIVLLGDRYGWEPLPEQIPTNEFGEIKKTIDSDRDTFDAMTREATGLNALALLEKWYRLDLNAVPPVYVLQPRTGPFGDYTTWEQEAERPLRRIFREAVKSLRLGDDALLKYDASATHQEIERGAMQVEDAGNHVFGFFRRITNLDELVANLPDTAAKDFVDPDIQGRFEKTAHEKLLRLKDKLSTKIGQENVYKYEARWAGQGITSDHIGILPETLEACEALLNEDCSPRNMCEAVWRELAGLIKAEVEKIEAKNPLDQENEAHAEFRKDRAKVFIGREDILNEIDRYIGDNRWQPLAIHGASGSGKSALMAKAIQILRDQKKEGLNQDAIIIERFIGATPESTNIRLLLEGLCKVINRAYAQDEFEVPEDFNKLVQAFKDRFALATSEKPLLIFLDALDQLSHVESAHNLNWLPSELPPYVKIVVSTLPEPYPCLNSLKIKLPPENIKELKLLSPQYGEGALEVWLTTAGRTLQEEQRREVLEKFSQCGLPLYLKLAFEEAKKWRSYDGIPEYEGRPGLAKDIPGITGSLFWRLSLPVNHGSLLVEHSLGYLAAAKNGLTEDEMLDVLSRDEEFYTGFKDQSHHEFIEDRLPVIIWSRLYFDLAPYLTERTADGTSLLSFYHRQLGEIVTDAYLVDEAGQKKHRQLARYFNSQKHKIESGDKKIPNLRKLSELPYQQTQGKMWNNLDVTLTDLLFIEAKCAAGMTYDLIDDFSHLYSTKYSASQESKKYQRFINRHAHRLIRFPSVLFSLIYNEGFLTAKETARSLIKSGNWHSPWFKMESRRLPELPEIETITAYGLNIINKIEFDRPSYLCFASHETIAYFTSGLGKIGMADIMLGRILDTVIETRRDRVLRLTCDSKGRFLVVAHENGLADIYKIKFNSEGEFAGYSLLNSFPYLLPEFELPFLAFTGNRLWYQDASGKMAKMEMPCSSSSLIDLSDAFIESGVELSGFVQCRDTIAFTIRDRNNTHLILLRENNSLNSHSLPRVDVTAICHCGDNRIAISLTSMKIVIYDVSCNIVEIASLEINEIVYALCHTDNELLLITQMGAIYSWEIASDSPPIIFDFKDKSIIKPSSLIPREDGIFLLGTALSIITFRPEEKKSSSLIKVEKVFASKNNGEFLAIQSRKKEQWQYWLTITGTRTVIKVDDAMKGFFEYDAYNDMVFARLINRPVLINPISPTYKEVTGLPADICSVTSDPKGGFWIAGSFGEIHYIDVNGEQESIMDVMLDVTGIPQIHCWPSEPTLLTWSSVCQYNTGLMGNDFLQFIVFFTVNSFRGRRTLEKIGQRVFSQKNGVLETYSYLPSREEFFLKFSHSFRIGSADDFVSCNEGERPIDGIDSECFLATPAPDESNIYLLSRRGDLFLVDGETGKLLIVYSGSIPINDMASQTLGRPLLVIEGGSRVFSCKFMGVVL